VAAGQYQAVDGVGVERVVAQRPQEKRIALQRR